MIYRTTQDKVLGLLKSSGLEYSSKDSREDGKNYHIETNMLILDIKLSREWIGYDLSVKESVVGVGIGEFVDTDNYSLEADPSVTADIAAEVLECLKGVIEKRLYVGNAPSEFYLAIPISEREYKLKKFTPKRRWWQLDSSVTEIVVATATEVKKMIPNVQPLS